MGYRANRCILSTGPGQGVPPLAQAQSTFQVPVQPSRVFGGLTVRRKPSPPPSAKVQPRKSAFGHQVLSRSNYDAAELPFFEQVHEIDRKQTGKCGVRPEASQGHAVPDGNLAHLRKLSV